MIIKFPSLLGEIALGCYHIKGEKIFWVVSQKGINNIVSDCVMLLHTIYSETKK